MADDLPLRAIVRTRYVLYGKTGTIPAGAIGTVVDYWPGYSAARVEFADFGNTVETVMVSDVELETSTTTREDDSDIAF